MTSRAHSLPCTAVHDALPAFVGGELAAEVAEQLKLHLCVCLPCRRSAGAAFRARRALLGAAAGRMARTGGNALYESMHATLHEAIMARVESLGASEAHAGAVGRLGAVLRGVWGWPLLLTAAALALLGLGYWLATGPAPRDVWHRQPLQVRSAPRAVPYAGPRVDLLPVGLESDPAGGSAANGFGPGMLGRGRLRIEDGELLLVPPPSRVPR